MKKNIDWLQNIKSLVIKYKKIVFLVLFIFILFVFAVLYLIRKPSDSKIKHDLIDLNIVPQNVVEIKILDSMKENKDIKYRVEIVQDYDEFGFVLYNCDVRYSKTDFSYEIVDSSSIQMENKRYAAKVLPDDVMIQEFIKNTNVMSRNFNESYSDKYKRNEFSYNVISSDLNVGECVVEISGLLTSHYADLSVKTNVKFLFNTKNGSWECSDNLYADVSDLRVIEVENFKRILKNVPLLNSKSKKALTFSISENDYTINSIELNKEKKISKVNIEGEIDLKYGYASFEQDLNYVFDEIEGVYKTQDMINLDVVYTATLSEEDYKEALINYPLEIKKGYPVMNLNHDNIVSNDNIKIDFDEDLELFFVKSDLIIDNGVCFVKGKLNCEIPLTLAEKKSLSSATFMPISFDFSSYENNVYTGVYERKGEDQSRFVFKLKDTFKMYNIQVDKNNRISLSVDMFGDTFDFEGNIDPFNGKVDQLETNKKKSFKLLKYTYDKTKYEDFDQECEFFLEFFSPLNNWGRELSGSVLAKGRIKQEPFKVEKVPVFRFNYMVRKVAGDESPEDLVDDSGDTQGNR